MQQQWKAWGGRFSSPAAVTAAVCCIAIAIGVTGLDQRAATFSYVHFHAERRWFDALTHLVNPLLPGSSIGLLVAAVAGLAGWRPGHAARIVITAMLAVIVVVTLKDQAKYAFGRLWPETWVENNPSWIGTGSYGFFPFHDGRGWSSFPSGHMAVMTAPATVVWRAVPWLRWIAGLAVTLVAVGLYGADYHFFSDIAAGSLFGCACGIGVLSIVSFDWKVASLTAGDGLHRRNTEVRSRPPTLSSEVPRG